MLSEEFGEESSLFSAEFVDEGEVVGGLFEAQLGVFERFVGQHGDGEGDGADLEGFGELGVAADVAGGDEDAAFGRVGFELLFDELQQDLAGAAGGGVEIHEDRLLVAFDDRAVVLVGQLHRKIVAKRFAGKAALGSPLGRICYTPGSLPHCPAARRGHVRSRSRSKRAAADPGGGPSLPHRCGGDGQKLADGSGDRSLPRAGAGGGAAGFDGGQRRQYRGHDGAQLFCPGHLQRFRRTARARPAQQKAPGGSQAHPGGDGADRRRRDQHDRHADAGDDPLPAREPGLRWAADVRGGFFSAAADCFQSTLRRSFRRRALRLRERRMGRLRPPGGGAAADEAHAGCGLYADPRAHSPGGARRGADALSFRSDEPRGGLRSGAHLALWAQSGGGADEPGVAGSAGGGGVSLLRRAGKGKKGSRKASGELAKAAAGAKRAAAQGRRAGALHCQSLGALRQRRAGDPAGGGGGVSRRGEGGGLRAGGAS